MAYEIAFQHLRNFRKIQNTKIYRSGNPDNVNDIEIRTLWKEGIRCIADMRSMREWSYHKQVDVHFIPKQVPLSIVLEEQRQEPLNTGVHYIFDLVSQLYVNKVWNQAPWHARILFSVFLFVDKLLKSSIFYKAIVLYQIKRTGLLGQYKDTVDYSQKEIYAGIV